MAANTGSDPIAPPQYEDVVFNNNNNNPQPPGGLNQQQQQNHNNFFQPQNQNPQVPPPGYNNGYSQPQQPNGYPQPQQQNFSHGYPQQPNNGYPQPQHPNNGYPQPQHPNNGYPQPQQQNFSHHGYPQPQQPNNGYPQPNSYPQGSSQQHSYPQSNQSYPQPPNNYNQQQQNAYQVNMEVQQDSVQYQDWVRNEVCICDNCKRDCDYYCYVACCFPCAIADLTTLQGNSKKWNFRVTLLIFISIMFAILNMYVSYPDFTRRPFQIIESCIYCYFLFRGVNYIADRFGIQTVPESFCTWFCCRCFGPICGCCQTCYTCQIGLQLREDHPVSVELTTKIRENNCFGKAYMLDEDKFCCC